MFTIGGEPEISSWVSTGKRGVQSKKSSHNVVFEAPVEKKNVPEVLTTLPPRPPPLEHEYDLRKFIQRK